MYFVPHKAGELFYLRTLLTVVCDPKSFRDLRTADGIEYGTYQVACIARGLLEDDCEWKHCLTDAAVFKTGKQLRSLFVTILYDCTPSHLEILWEKLRENICDDLHYALQRMPAQLNIVINIDTIYDYGLYLIDMELQWLGSSVSRF